MDGPVSFCAPWASAAVASHVASHTGLQPVCSRGLPKPSTFAGGLPVANAAAQCCGSRSRGVRQLLGRLTPGLLHVYWLALDLRLPSHGPNTTPSCDHSHWPSTGRLQIRKIAAAEYMDILGSALHFRAAPLVAVLAADGLLAGMLRSTDSYLADQASSCMLHNR